MEKNDDLQVQEASKKGSMPLWQKGLIGVFIAAAGWTFLSDDPAVEDVRGQSGQGLKPAQEVKGSTENRSASTTSVGAVDPLAAIAALTKKVEQLQRSNEDLKKDVAVANTTDQKIRDLQQKLQDIQNEKAALAKLIAERGNHLIEADRQRVIDGISSDELLFEIDGPSPTTPVSPQSTIPSMENPFVSSGSTVNVAPRRTSPYGKNYVVLAPQKQTDDDRLNIPNPFQAPASNTAPATTKPASNNSTASTSTQKPAEVSPEDNVINIDVPAYSFVSAELLHGVACPIGGAQPGVDSSIPGQPTVLPIRGVFKGPNGDIVDLGTAHLFGFCYGRITKTNGSKELEGRGEIKVEYISYWDNYGKPQHISVQGYIVSETDHHKGIAGVVDRVKRSYLAEQSTAAGMAAAATGLSSSQFTQIKDATNGTSVSQFSGDLGVSSVAQGVSALWNEVASQLRAEAASTYDSVLLNQGQRIKVINITPFTVTNPKERPEETIYDAYDVLI